MKEWLLGERERGRVSSEFLYDYPSICEKKKGAHIEVDNFDLCQADRDLKVSVAGGLVDKRSEEPWQSAPQVSAFVLLY